ncbi:MAG: SUMF1/EgtB/PvdO family nonheme iron enzyme [Bacteroidota bacterium]|nr:SUMF1/EgtB/PvdO family nonheme iron enzyme [Bacteroidota bacterium]
MMKINKENSLVRGKGASGKFIAVLISFILVLPALHAQNEKKHRGYVSSVEIRMIRINPGVYNRGCQEGDYDERPVHQVQITKPFYIASTEVTNSAFEQFMPEHKKMRGKFNTSYNDDDPVVFVSWNDAVAFCKWLSAKEKKNYRLPTEAEWEYACRAGTTTFYSTGDTLPSGYRKGNLKGDLGGYATAIPDPKKAAPNLKVGQTPPNAWGLYDMHGNVEEWCSDWYGPYHPEKQKDPVGPVDGDFKVTRGGSHTCEFEFVNRDPNPQKTITLRYLSSSNRSSSMPEDRNWLIGFRIIQADPINESGRYPMAPKPLCFQNVSQNRPDLTLLPEEAKGKPYFKGPIPYVIPPVAPADPNMPFYYHNHVPAITELPNGDFLAIWYNTLRESGRELKYVASRKRYGSDKWDPASVFFDSADRNEHGGAIWWNGGDTIFHFSGFSAANSWYYLALVMRYSTDNGATWSKPRFINPERGYQNMPIASVIRDRKGRIILTCDAVPWGEGGSVVWISEDEGKTWNKPATGKPAPVFKEGEKGAWIAGIHAPIVELPDGALMSIGRGDNINNTQGKSISTDGGITWTYSASGFDPIGSGQRSTLQRLSDGNIFFATFTPKIMLTDETGNNKEGSGLIAALSEDGGKTFPYIRLVVNEKQPGKYNGWGWQHEFEMTSLKAEPKGYVTSTVARNGLIHLISSGNEYIFNEKWIKTLPPAF